MAFHLDTRHGNMRMRHIRKQTFLIPQSFVCVSGVTAIGQVTVTYQIVCKMFAAQATAASVAKSHPAHAVSPKSPPAHVVSVSVTHHTTPHHTIAHMHHTTHSRTLQGFLPWRVILNDATTNATSLPSTPTTFAFAIHACPAGGSGSGRWPSHARASHWSGSWPSDY